jgi:spore germination cell wall hydrolase CwlJ-like protein
MVLEVVMCLAINIYHESRREPTLGQVSVAHTVMNRVESQHYPDNACDVVYQGPITESWKTKQFKDLAEAERVYFPVKYKCQFSWYCDGELDIIDDKKALLKAIKVAQYVYSGKSKDPTNGATHYHATYVKPYWATHMKHQITIGRHMFYK